jgi:serine protease Do
MNDALRTKLNLILTAAVAFALGLGVAARLDLLPQGLALDQNPPLRLNVEAPPAAWQETSPGVPGPGFSDIAERITATVVTIFVEREIPAHARQPRVFPPQFEDFFGQPPEFVQGSGSGFVISEDGYIITNNHVVESAEKIRVLLSDRREFDDVRLVGRDPTTDVALLKLDVEGLQAAPLGSSDAARVGEWVLAIGSPGFDSGNGPLFTTVTAGIVSAKGRSINILGREFEARGEDNLAIEDFIQTDAAINPGNSGGPLVNVRGEVIGVNAAIASRTGTYEGYGFAVPIDLVREVVEDLVEHGQVRRALLGVSIRPVDDPDARYYGLDDVAGAKVLEVNEGYPAAKAGIGIGDIIVAVNSEKVASVSDLQRKIRAHEPGETVTVDLVREDRRRERVEVELADAGDLRTAVEPRVASAVSDDPLGIEVDDMGRDDRQRLDLPRSVDGVIVVDVERYGPYGRRVGTAVDVVITSVNRKEIDSVREYREIMRDVKPGDVVGLILYVPDSGRRLPVTIQVPSNH